MSETKPFSISKQVVWKAYKRVKANKGAAGIDEESIADFERNLKNNLYKIWNRMSSGSYFPPAVLLVEIAKKGGGLRELGVPTVSDRIAQMVAKMYFEPEIDPIFHPSSYGYRPGKSAIEAVYAPRNVCSRVSNAGCACTSFVCDMSTGFSGNLGYPLPKNWAFDQISTIKVGSGDGSIEIDNNICSGRDNGVSFINLNNGVFDQIDTLYKEAYKYIFKKEVNKDEEGVMILKANELVAQYIRKDDYFGNMWDATAGFINKEFCKIADEALNHTKIKDLKDAQYNTSVGLPHLMATLNSYMWSPVQEIHDVAGWAGDLLTLYKDVVKYKSEYNNDVYKASLDLIGKNSAGVNFSLTDILGDIDAINIYMNIGLGAFARPINDVIRSYYDKDYTNRFSNFLKNRFNNSIDLLYSEADSFLTSPALKYLTPREMINGHFNVPKYTLDEGHIMAKAFKDYINNKIKK